MKPVSACPVCVAPAGKSSVAYRRADDALRLCRSCGSLYADPQYEPHELPAIYEEDFYNEESTAKDGLTAWGEAPKSLTYETYARVLLSRYPRLRRAGVRVLDYGCGLGQFLVAMKRRGADCLGIELSEIAARRVRETMGVEVITGAEEALEGQADGAFDLVALFSVLEHVREPARLARLVYRKLAPGGVLCAVVPNVRSLKALLLRGRCHEFQMRTHLTVWSMRGVRILLARAGFVHAGRLIFWGGRPGFGPARNLAQFAARMLGWGSALSIRAEKSELAR